MTKKAKKKLDFIQSYIKKNGKDIPFYEIKNYMGRK